MDLAAELNSKNNHLKNVEVKDYVSLALKSPGEGGGDSCGTTNIMIAAIMAKRNKMKKGIALPSTSSKPSLKPKPAVFPKPSNNTSNFHKPSNITNTFQKPVNTAPKTINTSQKTTSTAQKPGPKPFQSNNNFQNKINTSSFGTWPKPATANRLLLQNHLLKREEE